MAELSETTKVNYAGSWNYLKDKITDINNVEQTIVQLNSIKTTARNKPVTEFIKKNYLCSIMYQLRDNIEKRNEYSKHMVEITTAINKHVESQSATQHLREKLKDLKWSDVIKYKNDIINSKTISTENKLLIRLYTELQYPVRNDFEKLRVFIDKPRPATFDGNCLMLTRTPIKKAPRKKVVINKTVVLSDDESADVVFYPVRNIVWLTDFKTSKTYPDIIQSIPTQLANDIIEYCNGKGTDKLFDATHYALSKRIIAMFYQVSKRNIGINVLRHLKIMDEYKDTPMLHARKQTANMMGHSVDMQERYRLILD